MKDLPPLRIKGECLIEPDDQILYALAPEMAEALREAQMAFAALLYAQAVHPRAVLNRPDCIAATDLCDKALTQARAILARLPQKGGEK